MRGDQFFQSISKGPPFTRLHPRVAAFFKGYFSKEKAVEFNGKHVINTHFPPFPSAAFDQLAAQFAELGNAVHRRLYSVTLAVTNRCPFHCWHCYNAGRNQTDLPLHKLRELSHQLQDLGAVMVTLTGGEPLLRHDLSEIARAFDSRSCLILGTTGHGLDSQRATELRQAGVFAVGISLDSTVEAEHDRLRGRDGAFATALHGLQTAREAGLYPYVVSVATREFLERSRFQSFLRFVADQGALEVHLLEPSATGNLAGRTDVLLTGPERQRIIDYQAEASQDDALPVVSSFAYLESPDAFGCGAGLTHIYIDGSGEVCPCNLVPLSFGNLAHEPFPDILHRMGSHFCQPRQGCVGRMLSRHFPSGPLPAKPGVSDRVCAQHLPRVHPLPEFFRLKEQTRDDTVGSPELREAYNGVHQDYDAFWLSSASGPIHELIQKLELTGNERAFEAGCGTGYATALLARRCRQVMAVDISEGMQARARLRLESLGLSNVRFRVADALGELASNTGLNLVFSSWVLGYIPLEPFFSAAAAALGPRGRLAFVVHRDRSPREPLEIFAELVAEDPSVLRKRVAFDFPPDASALRRFLAPSFDVMALWETAAVFEYKTGSDVLEHLLKSGAGTAFYEALDLAKRPALTARFIQAVEARPRASELLKVRHDCFCCIAVRR